MFCAMTSRLLAPLDESKTLEIMAEGSFGFLFIMCGLNTVYPFIPPKYNSPSDDLKKAFVLNSLLCSPSFTV